MRLLEQHEYRASIIAASSAVGVVLREQLEARWREASELLAGGGRRTIPGFGSLLHAAVTLQILTPDEEETLRELQEMRNVAVHTLQPVDGRRAGPLVRRAISVLTRLQRQAPRP